MHVDVEVATWHRYAQVDERVGVFRQDVLVSRLDGLLDGRALDQPVVDEQDELGPLLSRGAGDGSDWIGRVEKGKRQTGRNTGRNSQTDRQAGNQADSQPHHSHMITRLVMLTNASLRTYLGAVVGSGYEPLRPEREPRRLVCHAGGGGG